MTNKLKGPSPEFIKALGDALEPFCKEREQISDGDKDEMQKRFIENTTFVNYENLTISKKR